MALDNSQQEICDIRDRTALVLAGPGCGKTHILALRIFRANAELGIPFSDMLCLTFTNRAAREMNERIAGLMGYVPPDLFVGNMHRFCFRFLFANSLIPPDTGILDETDRLEYLESAFNITRASDVADFAKAVVRVWQDDHDFPDDRRQRLRFSLSDRDYDRVREYMEYKERNMLVDFDEMILRTYSALTSARGDTLAMSAFPWIQVDEVQDMTPIQLDIAAILLRNAPGRRTCLYLGDEQQAIFSFTGAGGAALEKLKLSCRDSIFRLRRNYRSPSPLVALCNDLAATWLDTDPRYLPAAESRADDSDCVVRLVLTPEPGAGMVRRVRSLLNYCPGESVAVLVQTNAQGDEASDFLSLAGIEHIHLSRNDLFRRPAFKTLFSHIAVTVNPSRIGEWARLLFQTRCLRTMRSARHLCARLLDAAVSPGELLDIDAPTHTERFAALLAPGAGKRVVVFDTETTGLDIFADDVVQIAAVTIADGRILEGSEFSVLIRTERPIPREFGDGIPNPLLDLYAEGPLLEAPEAFTLFARYLDGADAVCGHNLDFDLPALRFNFSRRAPGLPLPAVFDDSLPFIDTLRASRLLFPRLRRYRLADMTATLGLPARTFHLALDDVLATADLAIALQPRAASRVHGIAEIRADRRLRHVCARFESIYGTHYRRSRALLTDPAPGPFNSLSAEMTRLHDSFALEGFIEPIEHYNYVRRLVDEVVVDPAAEPRFREQAMRRYAELLTFNEGDLFTNGIIRENVSVMTVHKAKGLEMENVLVYSADRAFGSVTDRARLFYVAFSRARKRLYVHTSGNLDPVVDAIRNRFSYTCR